MFLIILYTKESIQTPTMDKWILSFFLRESLIKWSPSDWRRFFRPIGAANWTQSSALWRIFAEVRAKKTRQDGGTECISASLGLHFQTPISIPPLKTTTTCPSFLTTMWSSSPPHKTSSNSTCSPLIPHITWIMPFKVFLLLSLSVICSSNFSKCPCFSM